jgi:hypothetical protein
MSSTTSPCPAFDGLLIVVISSTFGQLIVAAGTIADFGAVILLSVFFSGEGGVGSTLLLIGGLVLLGVVVFFAVKGAERSSLIRKDLIRLQDTTAQIRVRGAVVLLVGFAAIAEGLDALLESTSNVIMVPVFLAALVAARGLPALLYRGLLDNRRIAIAGLMQATSLPFIVAATAIGEELGLVDAAEGAALIGAGLLSVLLFPLISLTLLRRGGTEDAGKRAGEEPEALIAM